MLKLIMFLILTLTAFSITPTLLSYAKLTGASLTYYEDGKIKQVNRNFQMVNEGDRVDVLFFNEKDHIYMEGYYVLNDGEIKAYGHIYKYQYLSGLVTKCKIIAFDVPTSTPTLNEGKMIEITDKVLRGLSMARYDSKVLKDLESKGLKIPKKKTNSIEIPPEYARAHEWKFIDELLLIISGIGLFVILCVDIAL